MRTNPNVLRVTPRTVVFAPSFIEYALFQYLNAGKARLDIFREAGIEVGALGKDRLNCRLGNWLAKRKRGPACGDYAPMAGDLHFRPTFSYKTIVIFTAADLRDFSLVKAVYEYRGYPKGSRLIALMMPRLLGVAMNRKKISRLMRMSGLSCPVRRANPLRRIARAIQTSSVFSNKLNRQFAVCRPGRRCCQSVSHQTASDNGPGIVA